MDPLRIGVFSFVSTLPLIRGLEKGIPGNYELIHSNPSTLADRLRYGELDAALIPSVEFFRGVGNGVMPGLCIGSRGTSGSTCFLANEPLDQLQRVLVDRGSRTSVAMLRLLLDRVYHSSPDFHTYRPDPDHPLIGPDGEEAPAALIIGDVAMEIREDQAICVLDLGEWWQNTFQRPFVYALWAYRERGPGNETAEELMPLIRESFRMGIKELPLICEEVALAKEWNENRVHEYLTRRVHYKLDEAALYGLREFRRLCIENYLAPERPEVSKALNALATGSRSLSHLPL